MSTLISQKTFEKLFCVAGY